MTRQRGVVIILTLAVLATLTALPTTARVGPASGLQLVAGGRDGVATNQAGCTRITNRFCAQSTRSNCSACR